MFRRSVPARFACAALVFTSCLAGGHAQERGRVSVADLRSWLAYVASDELAGRGNYSAGLGVAAAYISSHLAGWHVQPAGDDGSFLQTVYVQHVAATSRSKVTIRVGRETRTFKDGEGILLPLKAGGRRTIAIDRVEFAGYGLDAPAARHMDFRGRDVHGALVVWLGADGPRATNPQHDRRLLDGRARHMIEELGAAASLTAGVATRPADTDDRTADFVTAERLDKPIGPAAVADDALLEFLFRGAPSTYQDLKRRAAAQQPLPSFTLADVSVTFDIDVNYHVLRTERTYNVVGVVPGADPELRQSYVAFGAHYDHLGYAVNEPDGALQAPLYGRVTPGQNDDRVWNGADDDGSGTVALMALAQAFAAGPPPRRSLLFVWHAGEEIGAHGSRYFADHPTVPLDQVVAQLNLDMIGRNRDDRSSEANTVYLVGADRISTELDTIVRQANQALAAPLTLSDEMNDPSDPEQIYYRSDHYSYAAHDIPVIFFTTGLHRDYHANTDEVSRIVFDKMQRVTELVYETGAQLANLDHAPLRDHLGPRTGR
jgi:hypothetical protein